MKEKKQYHTLRLLLGLLPAAALWSCTQDEFPSTVAAEEEGARLPLTVQVADAGFVSDGDLSTRTMDVGYKTTFTVGDSIGVYVSRERDVVPYVNLLFVLTDESGKLVWKNPDGQSLWYEGKNSRYYAYYPYQPGMKINADDGTGTQYILPTNWDADVYFAPFIRRWPIPADQSTHEKYAAADLMVCRGELDAETRRELTFTFVHQMVLLEIDLTEVMQADSEATVTYHNFRPWQPAPEVAVYRYLLQPERLFNQEVTEPLKDLSLSVAYSSGEVCDFEFTGIRDIGNPGKCKSYKLHNTKK